MLTILLGLLFLAAIVIIALIFLVILIPISLIDLILLSPVWIPLLIAGLIVLIIFSVRRKKILKKLRKGSSFAKLKNEGKPDKKVAEIAVEDATENTADEVEEA